MNSTPLVLKNVHGFTSSHTHTIFLCTRKILLCGTNNPETVTVGLPLPSTWVRGGTLIYLLHFPGAAGGGGTKKRPGFWSGVAEGHLDLRPGTAPLLFIFVLRNRTDFRETKRTDDFRTDLKNMSNKGKRNVETLFPGLKCTG